MTDKTRNIFRTRGDQIVIQIWPSPMIFFKNQGKFELKKSIEAVIFSIMGVKNWIINFKIGISPRSRNQEPSQTDRTEFRQNLFLESISQRVLVSSHSAWSIFGKIEVWLWPKNHLWLCYLQYGHSNPLQTQVWIEDSLHWWTGHPMKLTDSDRTKSIVVVGLPSQVGILAHPTSSF